MAKRLVVAGADALDVNLGPARKDGEAQMAFLVDCLAEVSSTQLCLDTTNAAAMEAGIVRCAELGLPKPILNSFSLQRDKLENILPLAAKYECEVIGLTMESSIPVTFEERLNLAFELATYANEAGIPNSKIIIDPVVLPLGVDVGQQHAVAVRQVIASMPDMFDPPVRTVCGLSNISNGAPQGLRAPINGVFMSMLAGAGLSCVIADSTDSELMRSVRLIKALRCRDIMGML
jgi:5-methyltetrahydrofolate corrinoid/iron sulfur protein methyltransferase